MLSLFQANEVTTWDEVVRVEGRTRYVTGLERVAAQFSMATQVQILAGATLVGGLITAMVTARSVAVIQDWLENLQWQSPWVRLTGPSVGRAAKGH